MNAGSQKLNIYEHYNLKDERSFIHYGEYEMVSDLSGDRFGGLLSK